MGVASCMQLLIISEGDWGVGGVGLSPSLKTKARGSQSILHKHAFMYQAICLHIVQSSLSFHLFMLPPAFSMQQLDLVGFCAFAVSQCLA